MARVVDGDASIGLVFEVSYEALESAVVTKLTKGKMSTGRAGLYRRMNININALMCGARSDRSESAETRRSVAIQGRRPQGPGPRSFKFVELRTARHPSEMRPWRRIF